MNVSLSQAKRLISTEMTYFNSISRHNTMEKLGVEKYEIIINFATACKKCILYDGKNFNKSDYLPSVTAPPFHPNCHCRDIPFIDMKKGLRAVKSKNGKTYYIDGNMKYNDWKKVFVDKTITLEEWQNQNKDSIIKEKIVQAIKDIGIKCEKVNYPPKPININDFPFDNTHANEERNHNVTTHEAKSFVKNAVISLTRFNNTYENYYSLEGISYVNIKEKYIRTAYKEKDYDERTKKIMEVLKQYAKKNTMSNNK